MRSNYAAERSYRRRRAARRVRAPACGGGVVACASKNTTRDDRSREAVTTLEDTGMVYAATRARACL